MKLDTGHFRAASDRLANHLWPDSDQADQFKTPTGIQLGEDSVERPTNLLRKCAFSSNHRTHDNPLRRTRKRCLRSAPEKRCGAETTRAARRIQRQEVIKMKRLFASVSAALLTCTLALPAMAQSFQQEWPQPANYNYHPAGYPAGYADNHPFVADFNHYFDDHPEIAQQLSADPRLIDN